MASNNQTTTLSITATKVTAASPPLVAAVELFDYAKRAQWLRAAVLGANDGLVSTASLMMGVGAVKPDVKAMILTGFAGLVAGACSMAIGEYVSVYSQLDIERAQIRRDREARGGDGLEDDEEEGLPSPMQAAGASALAFSCGAAVPLMSAAFVKPYRARIAAVVAAVTVALVVFGWLGAVLGNSGGATGGSEGSADPPNSRRNLSYYCKAPPTPAPLKEGSKNSFEV